MKKANSIIQSLYLKIKDNWFFALLFLILNAYLPEWFKEIDSGKIFNILNYEIPIWSLILSFLVTIIIINLYRYVRNKGNFVIIKATYGLNQNQIDITQQLKNMVVNNKLKVVLSNNIGGDPAPGIIKKGTVEYKLGNRRVEKNYIENDVVNLP